MLSRRRVHLFVVALLALTAFLLPASARQSSLSVTALAPVVLVVEGSGHLEGIAVSGAGVILASDSKGGRILRITAGRTVVVVEGLRRPRGVALDAEDGLLFVEASGGRVLRMDKEGEVGTLASGFRHPQWIGAAPDGRVYVTASRLAPEAEEGDDDEEDPEVVAWVTPEGRARIFAYGFRGVQGLTVEQDALVVAARGRKGEHRALGTLYSIPFDAAGEAGRVTPLVANRFVDPVGVATDRLGARFVSVMSLAAEPWRRRVIVKVSGDETTLFAEGLEDPQGLAFGPEGSLYLADGRSGRIVRFVAPGPPTLDDEPPAVTNQRQVILRVRAGPGSWLTALGGQFPITVPAARGGSVLLPVTLRVNRENLLQVFATAAAGMGLTSAPREVAVIHDDQPPSIELVTPKEGSLVRGTIAAEVASVDASGIAEVEFRLDGSPIGLDTTAPFRIALDTKAVADGAKTLLTIARDRAGNVARAAAQVTVDNTPPEVRIVSPTPGSIGSGPVEVMVEARDLTSDVARVEVAVNGTLLFTAESPPFRFRLDPEGPGPFVLVAAATDRAGNRGESAPVSLARSGVIVGIREPADGARTPAGAVRVRGQVDAGGPEVGVTVNGFPAAVQGTAFAALVPVARDTTSLTAVATTASGATASDSVAITVSPSSTQGSELQAAPQSGLAPLTVTFSLLGPPSGTVALDFDGNGSVDFAGPSVDGQTFTYAAPGLYFPTATTTDVQGNRVTASAVVEVFDVLAFDGVLQAKWTAFKDALRRSDIEKALASLVFSERQGYRELLAALTPQLGNIDVILRDISLIAFEDNRAEFQMIRFDNGVRVSYLVLFTRDDDGIWRLEFF